MKNYLIHLGLFLLVLGGAVGLALIIAELAVVCPVAAFVLIIFVVSAFLAAPFYTS